MRSSLTDPVGKTFDLGFMVGCFLRRQLEGGEAVSFKPFGIGHWATGV